jgi:membrane fusion protein (multidrug efflux system)
MNIHQPTRYPRTAAGFAAALGLMAVLTACSSEPKTASAPAAAPASAPPPAAPMNVNTVVIAPTSLAETVSTTGELKANEEVELRSEAPGRIVGLYFQEGKEVAAGTLLVKINDADLQAEKKRAEVQRQLSAQREQRTRALLDEKTISQQVYDEAAGDLKTIDAELDLLDARIAKTAIHAPFAGRIGLRTVSEGSYVTSSSPIATLQDLDPIKIDFVAPEKYAGRLRMGSPVTITVAGIDHPVRGEVYAVEPRIDSNTRSVTLRARAPNPDRMLLPGAFAKVDMNLGQQEDAVMVPSIALVPGLESTTVFVVEDGKAMARAIQVGQRTEEQIQVLSGLRIGERVITSGVQQLRNGAPVAFSE